MSGSEEETKKMQTENQRKVEQILVENTEDEDFAKVSKRKRTKTYSFNTTDPNPKCIWYTL